MHSTVYRLNSCVTSLLKFFITKYFINSVCNLSLIRRALSHLLSIVTQFLMGS